MSLDTEFERHFEPADTIAPVEQAIFDGDTVVPEAFGQDVAYPTDSIESSHNLRETPLPAANPATSVALRESGINNPSQTAGASEERNIDQTPTYIAETDIVAPEDLADVLLQRSEPEPVDILDATPAPHEPTYTTAWPVLSTLDKTFRTSDESIEDHHLHIKPTSEAPALAANDSSHATRLVPATNDEDIETSRDSEGPMEGQEEAGADDHASQTAEVVVPSETTETTPATETAGAGSGIGKPPTPPSGEAGDSAPEWWEGERSSKELNLLAIREGREFRLPQGWEIGRPVETGAVIDSEATPDSDDMIGMPTYDAEGTPSVTVSITDLSPLIGLKATLARATVVGNTKYGGILPDVPMLHPQISEGLLSLREGQSTPVSARDFIIDTSGGVTAGGIRFGQAQPKRFTYDSVDDAIRSGTDSPLLALSEIADRILAHRAAEGELFVGRRNFGWVLGEEGRYLPPSPTAVDRSPAQRVVQAFMTTYNAEMAIFARDHDIPILYRGYTWNTGIPLTEARQILLHGSLAEQAAVLERLQTEPSGRGILTTTPTAHDIFGVPVYARNTSPLRRLEDLVNTLNIWAFIQGEPYPFPSAILPAIINRIDSISEARRDAARQRRARLAGQRGDSRPTTQPQTPRAQRSREDFQGVIRELGNVPVLPMSYVENVQEQLANGDFTVRQIAEHLLATPTYGEEDEQDPGWTHLTDTLLEYVHSHPSDAVSMVNLLNQMGSTRYQLEAEPLPAGANPDTEPDTYQATFSFGAGDAITVSLSNVPSRRAADRQASIAILEALAGRRPHVSELTFESEVPTFPMNTMITMLQRHFRTQVHFGSAAQVSARGKTRVTVPLYGPSGELIGLGSGANGTEARSQAVFQALQTLGLLEDEGQTEQPQNVSPAIESGESQNLIRESGVSAFAQNIGTAMIALQAHYHDTPKFGPSTPITPGRRDGVTIELFAPDGTLIGTGSGRNRTEARSQAVFQALQTLGLASNEEEITSNEDAE